MRLLPILCALALTAAPLRAQPARAASAADTVKAGTYDLEITTDDGTITGTLVVSRKGNALGAEIDAGGRKPHVQSFVREGSEYVLTGGHDDFRIVYRLTFARDSLSGSLLMSNGFSGKVAGSYRK